MQPLLISPLVLAALDGYLTSSDCADAPTNPLDGYDSDPADDWANNLSRTVGQLGGWHCPVGPSAAELVRHGVGHLRRGTGPLAERLARCCRPDGAYFVVGVGWRFWAAAAQATDPSHLPRWCPDVLAGCVRLGAAVGRTGDDLAGSFGAVATTYRAVLVARPGLTASRLDRFFRAVARGVGREPGDDVPDFVRHHDRIRHVLRAVRTVTPLKTRRVEPPSDPADLVGLVAAAAGESPALPGSAADWSDRLVGVDTVADLLHAVVGHPWLGGDGFWLAAGVLHRRLPRLFPPWSASVAAGQAALDDAAAGLPVADRYRLLVRLADALRDRYKVHPLEVGDLLARFTSRMPGPVAAFGGFSSDTFRFLSQLTEHNSADWMAGARGRYQYAVRSPLVELCDALATRYVRPVLAAEYGWDVETDPRPGKALSSVNSHDFRRSGTYLPVLTLAFHRRGGRPGGAAQLFARLAAEGLSLGFRLPRAARADGRRLRAAVQAQGPLVFEALTATGGAALGFADGPAGPGRPLRSSADLREWATHKEPTAGVWLSPADAVRRTDDLVGEAIVAFDRLLPLFAAAVDDDPGKVLRRRAGRPDGGGFDRAAFAEATLLGESWLDRALDLLRGKRQLVLQGVPGTGKTHVARCLARHLTGDRPDLVSTVQFHPAYTYEEFVEGLRAKADGPAVTYPVEPGLLRRAADRAAAHPADPHVLLIDELNRGNLPRVFGELLYLLEYRDQAVTLPYSKGEFRLPPNLYLLATLNPADRSVTALDQATRRRFAFLDMPPDPAVLSRWLARHPPADPDPEFGGKLVRWFEAVNRRLARDFGPDRLVGHTYWLREHLTRDAVRTTWEHEVRPSLADLFAGTPDRLARLAPDFGAPPARRRPPREAVR